jgi:three-Cys-motif partner protein
MAIPQETVWAIDPHTKAKHEILKRYLEAWFPILGSRHQRVIYVDGFSGPGRYTGGEPGSPLIALQVAVEHKAKHKNLLQGEVVFLFVDERKDRVEHLKSELARVPLPKNFKVGAEEGRFDELLLGLLRRLKEDKKSLAPSFVFIDPFGFSGVPFELVRQVLQNPHCEVFITFMVNAVQRFLEHPDASVRKHFVELFGTDQVLMIVDGPGNRVEALRLLYQRQLEICAKFVRSFEIRDQPERVLYYLFFASNHPLGHLKMKESMWRADPTGAFRFSDNTDPAQLVLLDPTVDVAERVAKVILSRFAGHTVPSKGIKDFIVNETPFIEKHKTAGLRVLETRGTVVVEPRKSKSRKRSAGTFPDDVSLRFS